MDHMKACVLCNNHLLGLWTLRMAARDGTLLRSLQLESRRAETDQGSRARQDRVQKGEEGNY